MRTDLDPNAVPAGDASPPLSSAPATAHSSDSERLALRVDQLTRTYGTRRVLDGVSVRLAPGERVALIGPSGAGKSTLMRMIVGLAPADRGSGTVGVYGAAVQESGRLAREVREVRASVALIFQQFNLVGRFSLLKNVLLGNLSRKHWLDRLIGRFSEQERRDAMTALHAVGMDAFAAQRASTLSGGQQQRAAIARALVQRAKLLLADEPIAALDPKAAATVMDCLKNLNEAHGVTVLVSVHQIEYARQYFDRVLAMKDGKIVFDGPTPNLTDQRIASLYGSVQDAERGSSPTTTAPRATSIPARNAAAELAGTAPAERVA